MYSRSIRRYDSWAVAAAVTYTSLGVLTVNPRIAMRPDSLRLARPTARRIAPLPLPLACSGPVRPP